MSVPQKSSLGLPPSSNSLKLQPSAQKLNSGSATGNPRNKCALKPGHSLMDWIRLGNSGCDLSGTKGVVIPVSSKELSQHCTKNDAWMAIRGNVYNVTRYMDFHPGGPEELMRGVGKDATKLFDEVHAWVNYEQLLKKCFIGPLRNVVKIDLDFLKPPAIKTILPPPTIVANNVPAEIIPRFDWIQKRSDLTLYFYTKQFCNPGLIISKNTNKNLIVKICIANKWHTNDFELFNEINWPPDNVKVSSESGKIEINLNKTEKTVWASYGKQTISSMQHIEDSRYDFEVKENKKFNHNSFALELRGKSEEVFYLPIGYHLTFSCHIEGQDVCRSYTPVPKKYSPISTGSCIDLHFLLKAYENGLLSSHLNGLTVGSTLAVSQPKGNLTLNKFLGHTRIALLAAGSGITPMLGLLDHLLARNNNKIENLVLMFFNRRAEDIWCRADLEEFSKSDSRLKIINILSQEIGEWNGEKGHISKELLSTMKDEKSTNYSTFICVCGPPEFNTSAETMLEAIEFPSTAMHLFSG